MRAIINPFVRRDAIGPTTHTVLIQDKDSETGEKGKWVFVVAPLILQIELHAEHVRDRYVELPPRMPCFYVDSIGHHRPWTPSHSADLLKRYLPGFPVGVHRRFSYNYLLDAGCPPESVRIWMGHSTRGDEFWARGSTCSFDRHRQILEPYLLGLTRLLGFTPVRSAMR